MVVFVRSFLCPGASKGSVAVVLCIKVLQEMRSRLSLILQTGGAGDRTRRPWVKGKWFIPYTMSALQTLELSFCGCSLAVPSAEMGSFMVLWGFYAWEHRKAQPAVVLV